MKITIAVLFGLMLCVASCGDSEPAASNENGPAADAGTDEEAKARAERRARALAEATRAPENTTCPVMGNPVNPAIYVDHDGRRIGFCCPGCDSTFRSDPEKYLKKVDEEIAARESGD